MSLSAYFGMSYSEIEISYKTQVPKNLLISVLDFPMLSSLLPVVNYSNICLTLPKFVVYKSSVYMIVILKVYIQYFCT